MPAVAVVSIVLGATLALALVAAVTVILVQLHRTSAVLADVDDLLAAVPPGLAGVGPALERITYALQEVRPRGRRR